MSTKMKKTQRVGYNKPLTRLKSGRRNEGSKYARDQLHGPSDLIPYLHSIKIPSNDARHKREWKKHVEHVEPKELDTQIKKLHCLKRQHL